MRPKRKKVYKERKLSTVIKRSKAKDKKLKGRSVHMVHSNKDAGNALKFELYKEVMKLLEKHKYPGAWSGGWTLIRGLGKKLLRNDFANDSECADAIICHYHRLPRPK